VTKRAYTRESVVAEKLEAMVTLGAINTRYKDFYDVWFLAEQFDFDGQTLAWAVAATFRRRGTPLTTEPVAWTDDFANDPARQQQWTAFVRRSAIPNASAQFASVVSAVQTLLKPIVAAPMIRSDGRFERSGQDGRAPRGFPTMRSASALHPFRSADWQECLVCAREIQAASEYRKVRIRRLPGPKREVCRCPTIGLLLSSPQGRVPSSGR
jgi:hypothetical protein